MKLVLGRIIIDEKFIQNNSFNEINIKIVDLIPDYIEDLETPTLIVGWEKVKNIFGDNVSILNKRIKPNLFWTFAPNEKKQTFLDDTNKYINELYNDLIKDYEYLFIDPVIDDIQNIDNIIRFLHRGLCDCIYITEDFIYMFNKREKLIIGIDIHYYSMLGFKMDKVIESLSEISKSVLIEDYTDEGIYQIYKNHFNTEFSKKFIPLLESKKQ